VNAEARFRHDVTMQLLERAAVAWAADCLTTAERLTAAAWALVGADEFLDRDDHEEAGR
jgi:hypothetical protein